MAKKERVKTELRYLLAIHDGTERNSSGYVEVAEVGKGYISPFKRVTKTGFRNIKKLLVKYEIEEDKGIINFNEIIPSNLLYTDGKSILIWLHKAKTTKLNYKREFNTVKMPHLVFFANRRQLKVFAVKTMKITENTKLFVPMLTNLSSVSHGSVCMGNSIEFHYNNMKSISEWISYYENAFFGSEFNSDYYSSLNIKIDGVNDADSYWRHLFTTKKIPLHETKFTLKNLINERSAFFAQ